MIICAPDIFKLGCFVVGVGEVKGIYRVTGHQIEEKRDGNFHLCPVLRNAKGSGFVLLDFQWKDFVKAAIKKNVITASVKSTGKATKTRKT